VYTSGGFYVILMILIHRTNCREMINYCQLIDAAKVQNQSKRLLIAIYSGGSRKKYLGAWPLIIWEATTAKRNYYRTN